jgi:hypothetical protein
MNISYTFTTRYGGLIPKNTMYPQNRQEIRPNTNPRIAPNLTRDLAAPTRSTAILHLVFSIYTVSTSLIEFAKKREEETSD